MLGAIAAFACYLRLARTRAVNSDGAGQALQAWDMLHGNLLLHGWSLGDVSYYTTEVPQYALVEFLRGLNQDVVHVAAAMTYTLAVLLAALLAKGTSTGRQAVARVLITVGIMLAPQLASGVNILLSSPDHIGTSVPVMAVWLILDHARPRWYIPVLAGAVLGWVVVADTLVILIGVLPLAGVSAIRVFQAAAVGRKPLASQRYDMALGAAALLGAAAGVLALHVIHASGGFYMPAPATGLAHGKALAHNLGIAAQGLLLLGGADFLGLRLTASTVFTMLHVAGVVLAAWGTCLAAWRFLRDGDRVAQLLVAGVAINLAVYVLSTRGQRGHPDPRDRTRPAAERCPGRAPARRTGAGRVAQAAPAVLVFLCLGYLLGLAGELSHAPAAAQNQQLTSWLAARHLHTGLSGYWEANVVTLTSGDRVQIRLVNASRKGLSPAPLRGRRNGTTRTVIRRISSCSSQGWQSIPALPRSGLCWRGSASPRGYHVGSYTVLVWDKNLLLELSRAR